MTSACRSRRGLPAGGAAVCAIQVRAQAGGDELRNIAPQINAIAGCADDHGGAVLRLTEALPWWAELVAVPVPPIGLR